jgi:hypothetical protein
MLFWPALPSSVYDNVPCEWSTKASFAVPTQCIRKGREVNAAAALLDLVIAGVIALVGIGLMLEPSVVGRPTKSVIASGRSSRLAHG